MINKIVKKDIKSNLIPFIAASIAIIILTLILTRNSYGILDQYENIITYMYVLAGILVALLALTLLVYVLINNFYTDKHRGYLDEVKSMRKYLYYRIAYAFLALIYFLILALTIIIITTEFTWLDFFNGISVMTIVIFLNAMLVYFCFFMAVFYKTKYNFRVPIVVIIFSVLLIISLLTTLFMAVNVTFYAVLINTIISYLLVIGIILSNINGDKHGKFFIQPIEVVLIAIILVIGGVGLYLENPMLPGNQNDDLYYEEDAPEKYMDQQTVDYVVYADKETPYGHMLIKQNSDIEYLGGYSIYISGELDIRALIDDYGTDVYITNTITGEEINYYYAPDENYFSSNSSTLTEAGDEMNMCYVENYTVETVDIETALKDNTCLTAEQRQELADFNTFLNSEMEKIQ